MSYPDIVANVKHVERPLPELDHLHIRLYTASNLTISQRWNAEDVCSPYWRFYVNSSSGASVVINNHYYPLIPHRIHFVPAWVRWACHNTQSIEHLYSHFDVIGIPGIVVRECFPGPVTLPADPVLEANAEALRPLLSKPHHLHNSPYLICRVKSVLFSAISSLFASLPPNKLQRISLHAKGDNPIATTLRYIDDHLDSDLHNAILASLAEFSEDHFVRLFRKQVGQTPAQYVLERRLSVAAERLVFTNDSIDRIALGCGFPDRFYFSRMFRRRMGLPPAAYRKTSHQQIR